MTQLERTDIAQQHFDRVTGQVPIVVSDREHHDLYGRGDHAQTPDPFDDDTPLACGIENPDECEACT